MQRCTLCIRVFLHWRPARSSILSCFPILFIVEFPPVVAPDFLNCFPTCSSVLEVSPDCVEGRYNCSVSHSEYSSRPFSLTLFRTPVLPLACLIRCVACRRPPTTRNRPPAMRVCVPHVPAQPTKAARFKLHIRGRTSLVTAGGCESVKARAVSAVSCFSLHQPREQGYTRPPASKPH